MTPATRARLKIQNAVNKIAVTLSEGADFIDADASALSGFGVTMAMMPDILNKISNDDRIMVRDENIVLRPPMTFESIASWSGATTPATADTPMAHLCGVVSDILTNRIKIYGEALLQQSDLETFSNYWYIVISSVKNNSKFDVVEFHDTAIRVKLKPEDVRLKAVVACIAEHEPVTLTQLNSLCPEWRTYGDTAERQAAIAIMVSEHGVKTHTPVGKRRTATSLYLTDTAIPVEKREQQSNEKVSKADMIELAQMLVTLDARRVELTTELNSVNAQMDAVVDRINNLRK